jgi:hypothetical protein
MDPSNRVSYILGNNIRVDTSEIEPQEWLKIFEGILKFNRPHLKYLSNFKEIEKFMNGEADANGRIPISEMSDHTVIEFQNNIISTTRCIFICELNIEYSKERISVLDHSITTEPRFITAKILLFSNKGDFILWRVAFKRKLKDSCKSPKHNDDIITRMMHSLFSMPNDAELTNLIRKHPYIGKEFIKMLNHTTTQSISNQRTRLSNSEIMEKQLKEIENRLG